MCIMYINLWKTLQNEFFLVPVTIAYNFSLPMQGRGPTQNIRSCFGRRHRLVLRKYYMLIMCHTTGLTTLWNIANRCWYTVTSVYKGGGGAIQGGRLPSPPPPHSALKKKLFKALSALRPTPTLTKLTAFLRIRYINLVVLEAKPNIWYEYSWAFWTRVYFFMFKAYRDLIIYLINDKKLSASRGLCPPLAPPPGLCPWIPLGTIRPAPRHKIIYMNILMSIWGCVFISPCLRRIEAWLSIS